MHKIIFKEQYMLTIGVKMSKAKQGDKVKVHYIGTIINGPVFDNSYKRNEPMEFQIGTNLLIQKFEESFIDMQVGDKKSITLTAEDAYGPYMQELCIKIDRKQLPADLKPIIGMQLQVSQDDANYLAVTLADFDETSATLDGNHPLAGKDLSFDIELLEILK